MRTNCMMVKRQHRILRVVVRMGRAIGWVPVLIATLGIAEAHFKLLSSVALWLMAGVWIAGFELFLRFFDRYLSRN